MKIAALGAAIFFARLDDQPFQRPAQTGRNRHWLIARPIDKHMHEPSRRARLAFADLEHSQFILHRTVAQLADPQSDLDQIGKSDRGKVIAGGTDHESHHFAVMNIQATDLNQISVHRRVEEAVVGNVVDVTVGIVVVPACGDGLEVGVVAALIHAGFSHFLN